MTYFATEKTISPLDWCIFNGSLPSANCHVQRQMSVMKLLALGRTIFPDRRFLIRSTYSPRQPHYPPSLENDTEEVRSDLGGVLSGEYDMTMFYHVLTWKRAPFIKSFLRVPERAYVMLAFNEASFAPVFSVDFAVLFPRPIINVCLAAVLSYAVAKGTKLVFDRLQLKRRFKLAGTIIGLVASVFISLIEGHMTLIFTLKPTPSHPLHSLAGFTRLLESGMLDLVSEVDPDYLSSALRFGSGQALNGQERALAAALQAHPPKHDIGDLAVNRIAMSGSKEVFVSDNSFGDFIRYLSCDYGWLTLKNFPLGYLGSFVNKTRLGLPFDSVPVIQATVYHEERRRLYVKQDEFRRRCEAAKPPDKRSLDIHETSFVGYAFSLLISACTATFAAELIASGARTAACFDRSNAVEHASA